jgi:hypothetical protein
MTDLRRFQEQIDRIVAQRLGPLGDDAAPVAVQAVLDGLEVELTETLRPWLPHRTRVHLRVVGRRKIEVGLISSGGTP